MKTISKVGMKQGYWKIIDEDGRTLRSGFVSKAAAAEMAATLCAQRGCEKRIYAERLCYPCYQGKRSKRYVD